MSFIVQNLPMLLCLIVGTGLLITEAFLPGFGFPGISGIIFDGVAVYLAWTKIGSAAALTVLLVSLAIAAVAISLSLRSIAKGRLKKSKLVLSSQEKAENGYSASDDASVFLGKTGVVTSDLRPTGMADFEGVRLNVMSSGDYIVKGTNVKIVSVEGSKITVSVM